jgi:CDP-diacylglycerol---glycerol-3-phosphate 3-phosphatidyltransferase
VTRSALVDAVRGLAMIQGKTAFGESTMARSALSRFLTASRTMRNLYGAAKVTAFVLLGLLIAAPGVALFEVAATVSVGATVTLCVARGIPVLVDARSYLQTDPG